MSDYACGRVPGKATEKQVQAGVVKLYRMFGCVLWDTSQPMQAKITPGLPDLLVFCPRQGTGWYHETKTEDGKQTKAQRAFQQAAEACNQVYVLGGILAAAAQLKRIGFKVAI